MNYEIITQLKPHHFEEMYALEIKYYSAQFITPAAEAYAWYMKFPHSVFAAANEQYEIIGFINMFPVKKHIFQQIELGVFNDAELKADDLIDLNAMNEPLHMFLSCLVVCETARKYGVTQMLLLAATAHYKHVEHRCQMIITDNVTVAGERFSQKYGFTMYKATSHDSYLYKQPYIDFVKKVQLHAEKAHL